jgi:hypothetical protein
VFVAAQAAALGVPELVTAQTTAPGGEVIAASAARQATLPTLALADDEGAWVVAVVTSGGFTGRGTGSLTVSSAGESSCVAVAACPARLVEDARRSLTRRVLALTLRPISPPPEPRPRQGVCNDCVTTTLTVRRRDADGERGVTYSWDVTTSSRIPGEVLRLHDELLALTAPPPR